MITLLTLPLALLACDGKPSEDSGAPIAATEDTGATSDETGGASDDTSAAISDDTGPPDTGTTDTGTTGGTDTAPTTPDDTDDTSDAVFESMITVTEPLAGDQSCFRPGGGCASLSADESCVVERPLAATVVDSQTGDPVEDATVSLFVDDVWAPTPDETLTSDSGGRIGGVDVQTCVPMTWAIATDPHLGDTVPTLSAHVALEPGADDLSLASYSTATMSVIPALLGVSPAAGAGLASGVLRDCAGEPLAGAQVITYVDGDYPAGQSGHYFVDSFPERAQAATSDDGLWLLLNLPPGPAQIEAHGVVEGLDEPILLAYGDAEILADGVTLIDLQMGYCGALIPETCLDPCE